MQLNVTVVVLAICQLAFSCAALAAPVQPKLFPRPKQLTWSSKAPAAVPEGKVAIVTGDRATDPEKYAAEMLQRYVGKRFRQTWPVVRESADLKAYKLLVVLGQRSTCGTVDRLCREWKVGLSPKSPGRDGYVIRVGADGGRTVAMVGGSDPLGVVYGQDTLFQMLRKLDDKLVLYSASIKDWPSIPWRGRPHTDIAGYDRLNTWDAFIQARVNFIDLRSGGGIYATPPGYKLDKPRVARVVKEAHRRGLFVFANVLCAVTKDKFDDVIKTYEEYLDLGADGIYISIDDPGAEYRLGTPIDLVKRVVALGKKHGITGSKFAMVPGKEAYIKIDSPANHRVGQVPGLEKVLLFATCVPSPENTEETIQCGFQIPPAWWLNWPRSRGGFTNTGEVGKRAGGKQPYIDIPALSEGWWKPSWASIRDAGKFCSGVHPWGGSTWGVEYVAHVLNMWAWSPETHVWKEQRARIYDIIFGPDSVGAAMEYDDCHSALRAMCVTDPDEAGTKPNGLAGWPPVFRNPATRDDARKLLARMEVALGKLEEIDASGTLIPREQVEFYYLEPMRASYEAAKVITELDFPDYWWPAHEARVLTAVRAGNLEFARTCQEEVRDRITRECANVEKTLAPILVVDPDYTKRWLARLDPAGEARYAANPVQMKGDLSDPQWASAPKLGGFGNGGETPDDPTEVQLLYTDDALYIGYTCYESAIDKLVLTHMQRDSNVWEDDSVETFVNADSLLTPFYQLIASASGVQFDSLEKGDGTRNPDWSGEWEVKTAKASDRWTAEVKIPFATVGVTGSQKGRMWMLNFCRNDFASAKDGAYGQGFVQSSSYGARPQGGFHDTRKFRPIWFR